MTTVALYKCVDRTFTIQLLEEEDRYSVSRLHTTNGQRDAHRPYVIKNGNEGAAYRLAFDDFVARMKEDRASMFRATKHEEIAFLVTDADAIPDSNNGYDCYYAISNDPVAAFAGVEKQIAEAGKYDLDFLRSSADYSSSVANLIAAHTHAEESFCIAIFIR